MKGIEGLLAGRTLAGRYRVDEVIGRGGFAAVYRAHDGTLQRTVAVKVIMLSAPDPEGRHRLRARFHREARAAARLQHPNVVTIFDFGTDAELGLDFLVMELLPGEDLAARMAEPERIPPELALRVLREAVEGVAAGHRAGLIHRDVKPGNLFLAEHGDRSGFRVRVLDFGIAQIVSGEETLTQLTHGGHPLSPAYASPEQLRGERPLSPASDVFSLGVIGYELLSGERLFGGGSAGVRRGPVPSLAEAHPEVDAAVAEVISRAMAADAAARFPDAGRLARALDQAREGAAAEPEADRRVLPPVYRARRRARLPREPASPVPAEGAPSRRSPLLPAALVVLLTAGGLGVWALAGGGDDPSSAGEAEPVVAAPEARPAAPAPREEAPPPNEPREVGGLEAEAPPTPGAAGEGAAAGWSRNARALHREGLERFRGGDFAGAAQRFGDAARLEPGNASFRNDLGWALFRAGQVEEAADALEEVLRRDPRRAVAHANLGEVRLAQGDTAAAIAEYRRFLELNDDPAREAVARRKLEEIGSAP